MRGNTNKNKINIYAGIGSGALGGAAFGVVIGMTGGFPVIAQLAGGTSVLLGVALHIIFSVAIGVIYALVFGYMAQKSIATGLLYGVIWWFLGPLIIMPSLLGMGVQLSIAGMQAALPSLWGHLIYGLVLGYTYQQILRALKVKVQKGYLASHSV